MRIRVTGGAKTGTAVLITVGPDNLLFPILPLHNHFFALALHARVVDRKSANDAIGVEFIERLPNSFPVKTVCRYCGRFQNLPAA